MSAYVSGGASTGVAPLSSLNDNTVSLVIDNKVWAGWEGMVLTSGIERLPSSFEVRGSEWDPFSATQINIKPGSAVVVRIGQTPVLTGYIDRYAVSFSAGKHEVVIAGRSKCCDLVDCAVDLQGNSISNQTLLSLAQNLAKPYGVTARSLDGPGPILPVVNFFVTQSPYDIITQAARYCQYLVYDAPDGSLVLAQASSGPRSRAASGFQTGVNIESCQADYNIAARFSEYRCYIQSTDALLTGGTVPADQDPNTLAVVKDVPGAIRHRVFAFVAETGQNYVQLAQSQAQWELNRRRGRSQSIRVTTDTWKDSGATLWTPNTLASLNIPEAKLSQVSWTISEVTFRLDASGTHADLLLMPPESFQPQPTNLYLFDPNVAKALGSDNGSAQSGKPAVAPRGG